MAESVELMANPRATHGTQHARRLRKTGMVPAVVYGHKQATESLTLSGEELAKTIRQGHRVVDLKQSSGVQKALIREVQWDALGHEILHVDFARVAADERITLDVRVELRGTAPGIATGGVLVQPMHNLSVECLVIAVPESIRVNIGELQLNQAIHVKDLVLPPGLVVKNDPEAIVVQVSPKVVEAVAAPVAAVAAADQAEPEVIGRVKAEEEAAEEK
jgi:large subunit ribosomal protein L25